MERKFQIDFLSEIMQENNMSYESFLMIGIGCALVAGLLPLIGNKYK